MSRKILPGAPEPLGATWSGKGVNFALFSEHADRVELCLFASPEADAEDERINLPEQTDQVWHGFLPEIRPGQLYGYRVHGPYEPLAGHRFNPHKILLDPYAKAIGRDLCQGDELYGFRQGDPRSDLSFDARDNGALAAVGLVIDPTFAWESDAPPGIPSHKTIIYELHVKGFSMRHPRVPEPLRGTYAGLASPAAIAHLLDLGITAVELMPVHHHADEPFLVKRGLVNYWGYNTLSFFAPERRYASTRSPGACVGEFKALVRSLHAAGIEVLLDVVYNHTAEGDHRGPTLSFRGIDNASYYRLAAAEPRHYVDYTGCGNTLNTLHPRVRQLILDSLRYWVTEMHVDGFRFDLAPALARQPQAFNREAAFFDSLRHDPVLSRVKLIAEPWDLGEGGYQVGNFPPGWSEWNGKYRDTLRSYWKGSSGTMSELATRLCGSDDIYQVSGRQSWASVNYVTAHDGFTLHDLVSYSQKHNEANPHQNHDGTDDNLSANYGIEGPTEHPQIVALRERQKRNFLAALLFSQGLPMILSGDELGRTQRGNNNAYCQDNPLSWIDWELDARQRALLRFTQRLIQIRRAQPSLSQPQFLHGGRLADSAVQEVVWLRADGQPLTEADWQADWRQPLGMHLHAASRIMAVAAGILTTNEGAVSASPRVSVDGKEPLPAKTVPNRTDAPGVSKMDDRLLILLNPLANPVPFKLPPASQGWELLLDTFNPELAASMPLPVPDAQFNLEDRSLALLRARL